LALGVAAGLARLKPDWSFDPLRRGARGELEPQPEPEVAPA
jgi:hypothetical protein